MHATHHSSACCAHIHRCYCCCSGARPPPCPYRPLSCRRRAAPPPPDGCTSRRRRGRHRCRHPIPRARPRTHCCPPRPHCRGLWRLTTSHRGRRRPKTCGGAADAGGAHSRAPAAAAAAAAATAVASVAAGRHGKGGDIPLYNVSRPLRVVGPNGICLQQNLRRLWLQSSAFAGAHVGLSGEQERRERQANQRPLFLGKLRSAHIAADCERCVTPVTEENEGLLPPHTHFYHCSSMQMSIPLCSNAQATSSGKFGAS